MERTLVVDHDAAVVRIIAQRRIIRIRGRRRRSDLGAVGGARGERPLGVDKDYCSLVAPDEALSRQRTAGFVTLISDGSNCSLRALFPASYMSLGADPQSS